MQELLIYFLKSSGLIIVFFLAYHFLLRKETFFNNNRWFLLSGLITSALLPLFFIRKIILVEKPKLSVDDLIAMTNPASNNVAITQQATPINWIEIIAYGYALIVAILIIKVLINIFSLYKLLYNQRIEKKENLAYIDLDENVAPFSFFNFIVYNSNLYSEEELQSILLHEKVHSQQKHSLDMLTAKLFCIAFWFNPIVWIYKKAIVQNLEYIADNKAIQLIEDKKAYQKALLKVVSHQNCLPITNHFYQSLIKKRIVMLNKNQSHKRNSWKYALIMPALIAFVFLFQVKVVAQEKETLQERSTSKNIVHMNWTKNSSDEELKSDIKILKEQGITIKYSKLKRNEKGEIIAIKVNFKDDKGNTGSTQFNGTTPIQPILFYKTEDTIGFGRSRNTNNYNLNESYGYGNSASPNKEVRYKVIVRDSASDSADVVINDENSDADSDDNFEKKIIIRKNGNDVKMYSDDAKDGVVIMTDEEVEDIKRDAQRNVEIQLRRMRPEMMRQARLSADRARIEVERIRPQMMQQAKIEQERAQEDMIQAQKELEFSKPELEKAKQEMIQAKNEMMKARSEMQKAKAEFDKAQLNLKK